MDLVLSVSALGAASVLAAAVLIGVRNPRQPRWACDWLVANVWLLLIIGFAAFGFAYGIRFALNFDLHSLAFGEIALALGVAGASWLAVRVLAPKRRLSVYAAALDTAAKAEPPDGGHPPHTPGLAKAA